MAIQENNDLRLSGSEATEMSSIDYAVQRIIM